MITNKELFYNAYNTIRSNNKIKKTPLEYNYNLSKKYKNNIYFKREDLQETRSFKIRGSYNAIKNYYDTCKIHNETIQDIVCASAGNHAQGVALNCNLLNINNHIWIPSITPMQKQSRIAFYGQEYTTIHKYGLEFNETCKKALEHAHDNNFKFIHPYDDIDTILGQSTIAHELTEQLNNKPLNHVICPIGGGGLIAGLGNYFKVMDNSLTHKTNIVGVEPYNADSMQVAIRNKNLIYLKNINTFVDGASVNQVGELNFTIGSKVIDKTLTVSNGKLCDDLVDMYQNEGIILEPAGCLSVSGLEQYIKKNNLYDKNETIVCILSGGNNDIMRYNEIMENKLIYLGLKKYYIIKFSQTAGQLRTFINNILHENDDITRFEYLKKNNKNYGSVLIGVEFSHTDNIRIFENNMEHYKFEFRNIADDDLLYNYLI